jgi:uncharacterized membrane protein
MWLFYVLFASVLIFGAPILALYWAAQARRVSQETGRRLSEAENEVARLRRELQQLAASGVAVAEEPADSSTPRQVASTAAAEIREPVEPPPAAEPTDSIPVGTGGELASDHEPRAPEAATAPEAEAEAEAEAEPPVPAPEAPEASTVEPERPASPEPPPLPPRESLAPPPKPPMRINWEQWIGVRGAAVLGAIVLALAAILFLKFSIERGLIPPIVRVALAVLVGVGALVGAEWLRKRAYEPAANALSGGGVVVLYAAIWAARVLYEFIPSGVAFVFMALVTLVCGLLSWRHRSLVVALIGLTGGFLTPLLLSTGQDRPIGLFGYILMLDAGLLALARKRRWPSLAILSLVGTTIYEAFWIFERMDPERVFIGLGILAVFGLLYTAASRYGEPGEGGDTWRKTSFAGILLPLGFALYFAGRADLGEHLLPVALLLLLLAGAALWLSRLHHEPSLATAAAVAVVAVVLLWMARSELTGPLVWEAVGISFAFALLFSFLGASPGVRDGRSLPTVSIEVSDPALIATGGLFFGTIVFHVDTQPGLLWPWLAGWVALGALLYHQGSSRRCSYRRPLAAAGLGFGFVSFWLAHGREPEFPPAGLFFGLAVLGAVFLQVAATRAREAHLRRPSDYAAALLPVILLFGVLNDVRQPLLTPALFLATTVALALLVVLAATRGRLGPLYLGTVVLLALIHTLWVDGYVDSYDPTTAPLVLAALGLTVLLFTFWPFLAGKAFAGDRWALYGAALAAPAWFLALRELFEFRFGDGAIGALPIALGLVSLAAAVLARRSWSIDQPQGKRSLVWFLAVALSFVTLAIPLQLDKEWITIGWALQGLAMMALWKRLDHAGLKYFGLALLAVVTVRLVANPAVLGYYPKSTWPVFNWLMYTYLVPAAALLSSARVLAGLEVDRLRSWEKPFYGRGKPLAAATCGFAAVAVVFVWINLTIFDYFSPGGPMTLSLDRLPARDLTISFAWAVYAVVLLSIGMARKSVALRWVSLAFMILTIGKVFLYDLGELEDLYRVASLVGLALSLMGVSLAYQKFVFPKDRRREPE